MHNLLPYIHGSLSNVLDSVQFFMPEIWLSALFIVVLATDLLFGKNAQRLCKIVACVGILLIAIKELEQLSFVLLKGETVSQLLFGGMLLLTRTSINLKFIIDLLAFVLLVYADWDHKLRAHKKGLSDL
jgi:NADH-quinone oxidoreductase subunit N